MSALITRKVLDFPLRRITALQINFRVFSKRHLPYTVQIPDNESCSRAKPPGGSRIEKAPIAQFRSVVLSPDFFSLLASAGLQNVSMNASWLQGRNDRDDCFQVPFVFVSANLVDHGRKQNVQEARNTFAALAAHVWNLIAFENEPGKVSILLQRLRPASGGEDTVRVSLVGGEHFLALVA